jgi:hypothetical protein
VFPLLPVTEPAGLLHNLRARKPTSPDLGHLSGHRGLVLIGKNASTTLRHVELKMPQERHNSALVEREHIESCKAVDNATKHPGSPALS